MFPVVRVEVVVSSGRGGVRVTPMKRGKELGPHGEVVALVAMVDVVPTAREVGRDCAQGRAVYPELSAPHAGALLRKNRRFTS